jgi:transposase
MKEVSMIGLDLAKSVFQVHGVDAAGHVVVRRALKRAQVLRFFRALAPCTVALEACGTAHHWARAIARCGHTVRLVPPAYVKPFVKRGKNDAVDAEAICEAASRPSMRFVPVKSVDQQAVAMLHRSRALLVKSRTMQINALRAHLAEFGVVAARGEAGRAELGRELERAPEAQLPARVRRLLEDLLAGIAELDRRIAALEAELRAWHEQQALSRRLATIPGVGVLTATALAALVPDPSLFRNGRHLAAWLGLTPRQHASGGQPRLGRISKAGDGYLRRLLVLGATALLRSLRGKTTRLALWVQGLLARRPARLVTLALANKLARIAWAVMVRGQEYQARRPGAALPA